MEIKRHNFKWNINEIIHLIQDDDQDNLYPLYIGSYVPWLTRG